VDRPGDANAVRREGCLPGVGQDRGRALRRFPVRAGAAAAGKHQSLEKKRERKAPAHRTTGTLARTAAVSIAAVNARGIHHVGVAVADLDEAVQTYERLFGGRLEHRARVEEQGVEAATMRVGDDRIELLSPLGEDTPVGRFLAKRGPGMHHIAYDVEDVAAALSELAEAGAELIDPEPRQGLFGLEVAFVHPESVHGVLSEVVSGG
jgi:methylmalonyl-CoA/ethylmalonyl-CoA epimerase